MSDGFDELLKEMEKKDKEKTHCCECERGILHHVCMQYGTCKANSKENCQYIWSGKEYIVISLNLQTDEAESQSMTFEQWSKAKIPIIRIGDFY